MVLKVASDDGSQPFARASQRFMHALPQLPLDGLELGAHLLCRRLPPDNKARTVPGFPTGMREPQEIERLRLAFSTLPSIRYGKSAELDQSRFLRVEF
jgi:hypothetical protein